MQKQYIAPELKLAGEADKSNAAEARRADKGNKLATFQIGPPQA